MPTRTWTLGWSQDHKVSSRPCLLHPEPLRDLRPEARVERASDDAYRRSILGAESRLGEKLEEADGEQTVQPCRKQSDRAQRLSGGEKSLTGASSGNAGAPDRVLAASGMNGLLWMKRMEVGRRRWVGRRGREVWRGREQSDGVEGGRQREGERERGERKRRREGGREAQTGRRDRQRETLKETERQKHTGTEGRDGERERSKGNSREDVTKGAEEREQGNGEK